MATDGELAMRVERMRAEYLAARGVAFEHFFCPILHTDEETELCKGHVIPDALKICGGPHSAKT
jgi:hypothetical protein